MTRPTWNQWFMGLVGHVARRSHDPHTKHGAIIVDDHKRPLGFGYNGFPRGGDDSIYSTERPEKYRFIIHAEMNAILNCTLRPEGATMYVTGLPCARCAGIIVQAGIKRVIYGSLESRCVDKEEEEATRFIFKNHGVELAEYDGE